jgi:hypothetical protein
LKAALGGWAVAGTVFLHSGFGFSIVDTGMLSKFGNLCGKPKQSISPIFSADRPIRVELS